MSNRVLFSVVASILVLRASPVYAQVDPEVKTPYLWRIVLKTQPHPLLSQTFRDQLKRDLEASLLPAIGSLGTVVVIDLAEIPRDSWETLWQQFDDKGFSALEAPRDLTVAKTHFLKLEYKDGQYHLEARQHDGFTGLSSGYAGFGTPVIRKQSVRVPELVGRTAGILIDRDFGLDGTVEPILGNPKEVKVIVRGGQLGLLGSVRETGGCICGLRVSVTNRKEFRADPDFDRQNHCAACWARHRRRALTAKLRTNSLDQGNRVSARMESFAVKSSVGNSRPDREMWLLSAA